jgi:prepilin-type N-terminal cleavage/methylation domain-containing protein
VNFARPAPRTLRARHGFTLVEMLVTVTVLALLSSILVFAVQAARTAALVAKTKATIGKINQFVMARYDGFRNRRLAINLMAYVDKNTSWYKVPKGGVYPHDSSINLARARVNAIRDLMRMELPDRWSDVTTGPLVFDPNAPAVASALTQRFANAYNTAYNNVNTRPDAAKNDSAKLLYMIVMSDPEAAHQFTSDEIGAADGSGMPVFLDAWKNPIFFLRWPVGFLPNAPWGSTSGYPNNSPNNPNNYPADTDLQSGNATLDHDPFDPHGAFPNAYAVYPLIFSAGPDGYTDINMGTNGYSQSWPYTLNNGDLDPYQPDGTGKLLIGQPHPSLGFHSAPASTAPRHGDNIHNQHIEAK